MGPRSAPKRRFSQAEVNQAFDGFLQQFFKLHAKTAGVSFVLGGGGSGAPRSRPLFMSGESYAGRYIPEFAHYLQAQDAAWTAKRAGAGSSSGKARSARGGGEEAKRVLVDLRGVLIGNGWIEPRVQYGYADFGRSARPDPKPLCDSSLCDRFRS